MSGAQYRGRPTSYLFAWHEAVVALGGLLAKVVALNVDLTCQGDLVGSPGWLLWVEGGGE